MKVFELKKRKGLSHAIHAIALVENPAIETDFIYLSVEGKKAQSNIFLSEEKGIIYSPVLIPEQRIERINDTTGEVYQIYFSAETIEEAAHDLMKAKTPLSEFNEEHNSHDKIDATNVVELWLVEDPEKDKAITLGFKVPKGTLMAGIKVDNEEARAKIKAGKIKGISIEGLFEDFNLVEETQLNTNIMSKLEKTVDELVTKLKAIIPNPKTKLASIQIDEETTLHTEGEFEEGAMVYTDAEMTIPASGTYEVEGRRMVISEGTLASIEEVVAEEMNEATQLAEAQAEATIALNEKITALEKENAELKEVNASFKTELSEVKELAEKNATLLSKVEEAEKEISKVTLSVEDKPSALNNFLNNRKHY